MVARRIALRNEVAKRFGPPNAIGVLKEIKQDHLQRPVEGRVILPPNLVRQFIAKTGKPVFVESGAGEGIGEEDRAYLDAGAYIANREIVINKPFVLGVKETQLSDFPLIRAIDTLLKEYQHWVGSEERTMEAIRKSLVNGTCFLTLETMQDKKGNFPTLSPMSECAAEIISQLIPTFMLKPQGPGLIPSGLMLCGIEGLKAVVLGGGIVGRTSGWRLASMGLDVTLLEKNLKRIQELKRFFRPLQGIGGKIRVVESTTGAMKNAFKGASVLISGVYVRGSVPPKLVSVRLLNLMMVGAIAAFIDSDQNSTFQKKLPPSSVNEIKASLIDDTHVWSFSPQNIPSIGSRHSSLALAQSDMPFNIAIARKGLIRAALEDPTIESGISIFDGHLCSEGVAQEFGLPFVPFRKLVTA